MKERDVGDVPCFSCRKKRGVDIRDVLILASALAIIFWAVLKSIGIIHSPVWVEMIPYASGGVALPGLVYNFGKIKRGVDETENKVNRILGINERFNRLEYEHNLAMQGRLKCVI
ncbi:MAG: hypothetical protein Q8N88_03340 [Nanoarchaeota archaeon]|nr:hypothetical protein [Nanoarchaeota archaeon]